MSSLYFPIFLKTCVLDVLYIGFTFQVPILQLDLGSKKIPIYITNIWVMINALVITLYIICRHISQAKYGI